jgi:hypothetical protein
MMTTRLGRLRVSFSGAGFLGAWHLGAWDAIQCNGLTQRCDVAGASAGAIVGALLVSEAPLSLARQHLLSMAASCRSQPLGVLTPGYSLVDVCPAHLHPTLHKSFLSYMRHCALTNLTSCGRALLAGSPRRSLCRPSSGRAQACYRSAICCPHLGICPEIFEPSPWLSAPLL